MSWSLANSSQDHNHYQPTSSSTSDSSLFLDQSTTTTSLLLNNNMTITRAYRAIEMPVMTLDIILYGTLFYSSIFVVGVCGNLLVIYVLLKEKELRNFTNYLLANLSIADLMVLFTCVPSGLHDLFAKERWYLGETACYLVGFIENCMGFASILSIFFIACDRYYVICKPLVVKAKMTQSRTLKLIIFIWIVSILIHLPFVFLTEYRLERFADNPGAEEYKCDAKSRGNWSFYYIIGTTFVFYLVIGLVLVIMFIRISRHLEDSASFLVKIDSAKLNDRHLTGGSLAGDELIAALDAADKLQTKSKSKESNIANRKEKKSRSMEKANRLSRLISLQSALGGENTFGGGNGNGGGGGTSAGGGSQGQIVLVESLLQNQSSKRTYLEKHIKQRRQLIFMLMCVLFTFYICLFPLKIWNLTIMFGSRIPGFFQRIGFKTYWLINITVRIFFYLNSSINPILYNFLSKKFRHGFRRLPVFSVCFGAPPPHQSSAYRPPTVVTTPRTPGDSSRQRKTMPAVTAALLNNEPTIIDEKNFNQIDI